MSLCLYVQVQVLHAPSVLRSGVGMMGKHFVTYTRCYIFPDLMFSITYVSGMHFHNRLFISISLKILKEFFAHLSIMYLHKWHLKNYKEILKEIFAKHLGKGWPLPPFQAMPVFRPLKKRLPLHMELWCSVYYCSTSHWAVNCSAAQTLQCS